MNRQIEQEYREALDGLRFSDEAKERMMKNLMEQKGQNSAKRRRFRPLRAGLIAACLCAALLGTAGAVQIFSVRVNVQSDLPGAGYVVTGGIAYFPADSFSQEVWDLGEQEVPARSFSTWDELEQFVGWNLMDNPVLEGAPKGILKRFENMQGSPTNVLLSASTGEEGLFCFHADDSYRLDDILIQRYATVYTDHALESFTAVYGEGYDPEFRWFPQGRVSTEEYTTPNGLAVSIVRDEGRFTEYIAHCSINGVRCSVSAIYQGENWREDHSEHVLEVLKQVLDGFE